MKSDDDRELVYSSEQGWTQNEPRPGRTGAGVQRVPDDGIVRVSRERRRGSVVSAIAGVPEAQCEAVAKQLKRHCGSGGTVKHGVVEIQGDHRDTIVAWLQAAGYKAKRAGG